MELKLHDRVVVGIAGNPQDDGEGGFVTPVTLKKGRVAGNEVDGMVPVTFSHNDHPTLVATAQVFPLYRYNGTGTGKDATAILPLFMTQNPKAEA